MSNNLLEAVVQTMEDGVVILSADRRILYVNRACERIFNSEIAAGDLLSGKIYDPPLSQTLAEALSDSHDGESHEVITTIGNKSFHVKFVALPLDTSRGLILFLHDITTRKRIEAIKRDFVANVSHELRTPLASIKGFTETLLDGAVDDGEVARDFLTIIDKHASRMTALIKDLLTLSMLESYKMTLVCERVDIRAIIDNTIDGVSKRAKDKGIDIIKDIDSTIGELNADKSRLEQVIVNLIDNAIKYTNSGEIRVSAWSEKNTLRIDVKDTGLGIPAKDIPRIFERFYRVDKGRSRELGGTGLGLAIVKHIINGHNGDIWVESVQGQGSTFRISLPYQSCSSITPPDAQ